MSASEDYLHESDLCATEHIVLGSYELFREYSTPNIGQIKDSLHTTAEVMRGVELFPGSFFSGPNPSQSRVLKLLDKKVPESKVYT